MQFLDNLHIGPLSKHDMYYCSIKLVPRLVVQYNTIQKVLFRNEGHRPIIQNSHNTVLTRSGKCVHVIYTTE